LDSVAHPVTFEAGPHQGFNGDPAAIEEFCAALS